MKESIFTDSQIMDALEGHTSRHAHYTFRSSIPYTPEGNSLSSNADEKIRLGSYLLSVLIALSQSFSWLILPSL